MAEYRYNAIQTVPANGTVVFSNDFFPCTKGLIIHQDDSGLFQVKGVVNNPCSEYGKLKVNFGANVAIPTGGTVGEIGLAVFVDGEEDPSGIMLYTPPAVETFGNVSVDVLVEVPWICGCGNVSVRNIYTEPILVQNSNLVIGLDRIVY